MLTSVSITKAEAATIAVNFVNGSNNLTLPSAFGIPSTDWTQTNDSATDNIVVDGVTVSWQSSNTFRIGGTPVTGEDQVYNGYLDDGAGGPTIGLTGLSSWLNSVGDSRYQITVIMASGDSSENGFGNPDLLDNSNTLLETFNVSGSPSYNGGTSLVGTDISNLYNLDGITIDGKQRNEVESQTRGSIAGIIITSSQAVPEPTSSLSLLALATLGAATLKRKQKAK